MEKRIENKKVTPAVRKVVSLLLSFVMLLSIIAGLNLSAYAEEEEVIISGDYKYIVLDDGTAEICRYTGSDLSVTIPSNIDGYTVTTIGSDAFNKCVNLLDVTIPNSVTYIGEGAFVYCYALKNVVIPNHITSIENRTFEQCTNLNNVTIPNSVTKIGDRAFYKCESLRDIIIPENVISVGENAFAGCYDLGSITFLNKDTQLNSPDIWKYVTIYGYCNSTAFRYAKGNLNEFVLVAGALDDNHVWSDGEIINAATVTKDGLKRCSCEICWISKTEVIPALGLDAPTLKATVNSDGSFTLNWNKIVNADAYELYLQNADGTYKLLKSTTATSLTTAVAAYGKTYTYKVRALSNSENFASDYSATVSATNTKKLQTPTMKATVNTTGTFKLSWNAIAGATSYQVYLKNADGTYKLLKTTTATSLTTGVAAYGKSYTYKVRAITSKNSSATSAYSATVTATNTKKLQTPTLKVTVNSTGSFKLSWNKITGATSYKVYLKNADGSYKLLKTTTATSLTTGVAAYGKSYTYKVLAVKGSVTSAYSATVTAKNSKKLQTPSGVKAVTNKNGSFTISWNKVTGATSYQVYVLDSKTNKYKLLKTTTSNKVTTGVAAKGKTYKYKVRALTSKNSSATSAYSSIVSKKR